MVARAMSASTAAVAVAVADDVLGSVAAAVELGATAAAADAAVQRQDTTSTRIKYNLTFRGIHLFSFANRRLLPDFCHIVIRLLSVCLSGLFIKKSDEIGDLIELNQTRTIYIAQKIWAYCPPF